MSAVGANIFSRRRSQTAATVLKLTHHQKSVGVAIEVAGTAEEIDKACKKSVAYRAPGA
jgi:hypothetical protein